jgi:hypothetical protein
MTGQEIIARLREHEQQLRSCGVSRAALFGSRARGDHRPDSDTDILVEIDPSAPVGLWEYVALTDYIATLFAGPVHVSNRDGLKSYVKPNIMADAIYAF